MSEDDEFMDAVNILNVLLGHRKIDGEIYDALHDYIMRAEKAESQLARVEKVYCEKFDQWEELKAEVERLTDANDSLRQRLNRCERSAPDHYFKWRDTLLETGIDLDMKATEEKYSSTTNNKGEK